MTEPELRRGGRYHRDPETGTLTRETKSEPAPDETPAATDDAAPAKKRGK